MTRDELVNLIQKLDQRGASEQEIATIVDSYKHKLSSPLRHVDPNDPTHSSVLVHDEVEETTPETTTDTVSEETTTTDATAETTPPQTTTIEHLTPEEFGLEGYEKAQSQATDKIGYEDYLVGQLKNKYGDIFKFEPAVGGMSGLKITPVTKGESIKLLGGFNEPGMESEQEGIGTNVLNLSNITKYIEENLPDQELHSEEIKALQNTGLTPEDYPTLTTKQAVYEERYSAIEKTNVPVLVESSEKIQMNAAQVNELVSSTKGLLSNEFNKVANSGFDYAVSLANMETRSQLGTAGQDGVDEIKEKVYENIKQNYPSLSYGDFIELLGSDQNPYSLFNTELNKTSNIVQENRTIKSLAGASQVSDEKLNQYQNNFILPGYDRWEGKKLEINNKIYANRKAIKNIIAKYKDDPSKITEEDKQSITNMQKEIDGYEIDIQDLAKTAPRLREDKIGGAMFDDENFAYTQSQIDKFALEAKSDENFFNPLKNIKSEDPTLTDWEAMDRYYKSLAFTLQDYETAGLEETISIDAERLRSNSNPQKRRGASLIANSLLFDKVKEFGIEEVDGNYIIPVKTMLDMGYDGRDFDEFGDLLGGIKGTLSDKDIDKLFKYETATNRVKGQMKAVHEMT